SKVATSSALRGKTTACGIVLANQASPAWASSVSASDATTPFGKSAVRGRSQGTGMKRIYAGLPMHGTIFLWAYIPQRSLEARSLSSQGVFSDEKIGQQNRSNLTVLVMALSSMVAIAVRLMALSIIFRIC